MTDSAVRDLAHLSLHVKGTPPVPEEDVPLAAVEH